MRTDRRFPPRALALLALGAALAGCRQDMHNQARFKPNGESRFYADGQAMRPIPAGTVAQGQLRADRAFYTGMDANGEFLVDVPARIAVDRSTIERGRQRFDIYCAPCHGRLGTGDGMIVQRGFRRPPSLHDPRLRATGAGYFFDVMTNGFGQMPSYASQVPAEDRWAIVIWMRTLQLSQAVPAAALDTRDQQAIAAAAALAGAVAPAGGH